MGDSMYDPTYTDSNKTNPSDYFMMNTLNMIPILDYDQTLSLIEVAQKHLEKLETREIARRRDEIMRLIEKFQKDFPDASLEY